MRVSPRITIALAATAMTICSMIAFAVASITSPSLPPPTTSLEERMLQNVMPYLEAWLVKENRGIYLCYSRSRDRLERIRGYDKQQETFGNGVVSIIYHDKEGGALLKEYAREHDSFEGAFTRGPLQVIALKAIHEVLQPKHQ